MSVAFFLLRPARGREFPCPAEILWLMGCVIGAAPRQVDRYSRLAWRRYSG
ncbi:MAG: hypothetical protein ABIT07_01590 [Ferruginibacter sp.]